MGSSSPPGSKAAVVVPLPLRESEPPPEAILEAVHFIPKQIISDYDEEIECAIIITGGGVDLYVRDESPVPAGTAPPDLYFCSLSAGDVLHAGVFTDEGMAKGEYGSYRAVARTEVTGLLVNPDMITDARVTFPQRQARMYRALHALATALNRSLEVRLHHRADEVLFDGAIDAERDKRHEAEKAMVKALALARTVASRDKTVALLLETLSEKEALERRLLTKEAEIRSLILNNEQLQGQIEELDKEEDQVFWREVSDDDVDGCVSVIPDDPTKNPPKGG